MAAGEDNSNTQGDLTLLSNVVRHLLGDTTAMVVAWTQQPLQDGFSGFAVARFQGHAQTATGEQPWSQIRKVITPSGGSPTPEAWDYWQREVLAYQSGIPVDLPAGLAAPRCLAIDQPKTDECWLWLEDIGTVDASTWPLARYGLAARHLGRWNGAYLTHRALPQDPWWRGTDVAERLALAEAGIAELPQLRHNPLFVDLLTGDRVARIQALWAARATLLAGLAQLPRTLCHRDAGPRNLMSRVRSDGSEETVALDWGMAGQGMLGEEIVPLFNATLTFVAIPIEQIAELDRLIFTGYVAGLRDAGWQGDERLVRFGFTALAALKAGVADPAIKMPSVARRAAALPPGVEPPRLLNPGGYAQTAAVGHYLLDLGDEACRLKRPLFETTAL